MEPEEVVEQVTKESRERWFGYLALTTVILAVCATLASFKEGNNSVDSVLNQTQAANQWSYFQAKSIKSYLYEMQKDKLTMDLKAGLEGSSPALSKEYSAKIDFYAKEMDRYAQEKKDIAAEAKKFEQLRDEAQRRAEAYGIAVIFLQMGILLSSVAALVNRKALWIVGCFIGVVGIVYFINGMWLLF
ncbi:MAG: DUF4337 domain-containing protein [Desulfomonile sp.]|nr:DUF4337 domain-containing protein [Desulfomonile sp.]